MAKDLVKEAVQQVTATEKKINKQSSTIAVLEGQLLPLQDDDDSSLRDLFRIRDKLRVQIKQAEKVFADNVHPQNGYMVLSFYTKYTEVLSEIRSMQAQRNLEPMITTQVLKPLVDENFQNFLEVLFHLSSALKKAVPADEYADLVAKLETYSNEHASYVLKNRDQYSTKLAALLIET